MQSVKNGFAPPFSLCFSKSRAARQSPFCKAVARPFQSRRKALPKSTKTGRKSVGFLILTQAPKCTRSHCFPPQKHPKNGFVMRFAGKNSFLQVRSAHVLILSALSQRPCRWPGRTAVYGWCRWRQWRTRGAGCAGPMPSPRRRPCLPAAGSCSISGCGRRPMQWDDFWKRRRPPASICR